MEQGAAKIWVASSVPAVALCAWEARWSNGEARGGGELLAVYVAELLAGEPDDGESVSVRGGMAWPKSGCCDFSSSWELMDMGLNWG